ncbi:MAG: 4Fe-4S binding protein [Candidatus Diapherotrites archaeon]|nr:4Fe-4S binding protein [Candidatus Diapherotrites archaeon]
MHPDSFRGKLIFDKEKCVGCSACSKACPSDACKINKKMKKAVFDFDKCVMCGNCVRACKFSALSFEPKK